MECLPSKTVTKHVGQIGRVLLSATELNAADSSTGILLATYVLHPIFYTHKLQVRAWADGQV